MGYVKDKVMQFTKKELNPAKAPHRQAHKKGGVGEIHGSREKDILETVHGPGARQEMAD